jgi:hypothetical protein
MSLVKINKQQVELTPIDKNYTSQSEMIEDQSNQFVDFIYSDGENFWQYLGTTNGDITDYKSLGGVSESAVSVSGYNYIICETVNTEDPATDALANGVNLITKYAEAVALDIGTKAVDNRAVLLLMPGDYDLGDTTLELEPFVDVIGISTNAADTIIRMSDASAGQLTINWQDSDAMVSNVDIRADVANDGIAIGGGDSSYVKLENVIFGSDNPTSNSDGSIKGFNDFNGELNRIRFSELIITNFLWVDGNINGTFKDIIIGDVTGNAFFYSATGDIGNNIGIFENIVIGNVSSVFNTGTGNINGTFKNIVIGDVDTVFFSLSNIGNNIGIFENIVIGDVSNTVFNVNTGDINGTFKDIIIGNIDYGFYTNTGNINGTFKNIVIGDVTSINNGVFYVNTGDINGTFKDITIGNVSNYLFYSLTGNINGTFKDIVVGNVGNVAFNAGTDMNGTFKDIVIGNVTSDAFVANTDINGTFENIRIGDVGNNTFYSLTGDINGTFKDIVIGIVGNNTFYSLTGDMNGTFKDIVIGNVTNDAFVVLNGNIGNDIDIFTLFENIRIGDVSNVFFANTDINGTFKDIVIGDVTGGYGVFNVIIGDVNGTFKDIVIGDVVNNVFYAGVDINGTFKDIIIGDVSDVFYAGADMNGTFKDIVIGIVGNDAFYAATGSINGTFKDIVIGDVGGLGGVFVADSNIGNDIGIFENIVVGNVIGGSAFYVASGDMDGTFKDIVIGDVVAGAFYTGGNIGNINIFTIFENIRTGDVGVDAFYAAIGDINGTFKDITIGDVTSNVFYAGADINGTFKDIVIGNVTNDAFYAGIDINGTFKDIVIGDVAGVNGVFYAGIDINGTFKDITIGDVAGVNGVFVAASSNDYSNCTFININCAKAFQQDTFNGKIYDTTIDSIGLNLDGIRDLASGAIIERCKFIVDSGNVSINTQDIGGVTAQILYTITNQGISNDITPPTTNHNIDDPNII